MEYMDISILIHLTTYRLNFIDKVLCIEESVSSYSVLELLP